MLAMRMKTQFARAAFFRLQPKLSMALAWRFSKTAMTVEKLAKVMNRKNRDPQRRPPAIFRKTLGRIMKISAGPCPGSTSKAKQAGKMIRPAIRATKVSSRQMRTASLVRVLSRLM